MLIIRQMLFFLILEEEPTKKSLVLNLVKQGQSLFEFAL